MANYCMDCGREICDVSIRCHICANKFYGKKRSTSWKDTEIELLKENWQRLKDDELATIINRPRRGIAAKRLQLGLRRRGPIRTLQRWTESELGFLQQHWQKLTDEEIAQAVNHPVSSIRAKRYELGLKYRRGESTGRPLISQEVIDQVCEYYKTTPVQVFNLKELAEATGIKEPNLPILAKRFGLTDKFRPASERSKRLNIKGHKEWFKTHEHPRGMLGKKHTKETRRKMSNSQREYRARLTPEERSAISLKGVATRVQRYGRGGPRPSYSSPFAHTKKGKREDLNDIYFRSSWEANYARYLNFLIKQGEIDSWEYEIKTFAFLGIKRGVRSFTPDFRVVNKDGGIEYHEVTGYCTAKKRTALKRMAKYYPDVKIVHITEEGYYSIAKWKALIPEWE